MARRALAGGIAAGHLQPAGAGGRVALPVEVLTRISRTALVQGFEWIVLYGGVAACVLAAASLLVFHGRTERS